MNPAHIHNIITTVKRRRAQGHHPADIASALRIHRSIVRGIENGTITPDNFLKHHRPIRDVLSIP